MPASPIVHNHTAGLPIRTGDQNLSASQKADFASNFGNSNAVSPRLFATGGNPATNAADFTNATPVVTEIYYAELYVPQSVLTTGIGVFNGSDATDSIKVALFTPDGTMLLATADTQQVGTDAYQRIAWTAGATQIEPGTYIVAAILDGTTSRLNCHTAGNFAAGKLTGHVYATAFDTTATSGLTFATTFTTALGPVASLY